MKSLNLLRPISFFILLALQLLSYNLSRAGILYVNGTATGANDGSTWPNAFPELQSAIDAALPGDEIWVAAGTYFPTSTHGDTSSIFKTFYVNKNIKIYGGFEGLAGTEGQFETRDYIAHTVILSGDLGLPDSSDNALTVMWLDHVGVDMTLDGFTITLGFGSIGGGIFNDGQTSGSSSPVIANCTFDKNTSMNGGGAFANMGSEGEALPVFMNCLFKNNLSSGGGAIINLANPAGNASPVLINCQFRGNAGPTAGGGAIENVALSNGISSPQLYNCLFSGNSALSSGAIHSFANASGTCSPHISNCTFAANFGGSITTSIIGGSVGEPVITNSIFWGNSGGGGIFDNGSTTTVTFSLIPFGVFPGEGNIGLDPMFVSLPVLDQVPTTNGDFHLTAGSPAINAGDNTAVEPTITTDLDGLPRIHPENGGAGIVDMGAYEFQSNTTAISEIAQTDNWNITPNPASNQINISIEPSHSSGWFRMADMHGHILMQKLLEVNTSHYSFDIRSIPAGTYLVQVISNDRTSIKKVVIE